MASIDDNNALLLYRVGPVLCCSPCLPVASIIEPPHLTQPPGSSPAQPGIFKHAGAIVSALDLRYKFGVEENAWCKPGRSIITQLEAGHIGFYVDTILDVITTPARGWGALPALLPRGIFTRTLLLKQQIYLYADFRDLQRIPDSGYLRQYIQHLQQQAHTAQRAQAADMTTPRRAVVVADASTQQWHHAAVAPHTPITNTPTSVPLRALTTPATTQVPTAVSHADTPVTKPGKSVRVTSLTKSTKISTAHRPVSAPVQAVVNTSRPVVTPRATRPVSNTTPTLTPPRAVTTTSTPARLERAHSAHTAVSSNTQHNNNSSANYPTLWFVLLLLVSGGAAIWYILQPQPSSMLVQNDNTHSEADITLPIAQPTLPTSTSTPTAKTPLTTELVLSAASETPSQAQTDVSTPAPIDAPHEDQHVSAVETPAATPVKTPASEPRPTANPTEHHAQIEQDAQGLTITLDAPADDPVFKQTAADASQTPSQPDVPEVRDTATEAVVETNNAALLHKDPATSPVAPVTSVEIIHIVVKGDTLWAIAKRYVNNPFLYPELARLSKIKNPDRIYPGNRIRIIKRQRQP